MKWRATGASRRFAEERDGAESGADAVESLAMQRLAARQ